MRHPFPGPLVQATFLRRRFRFLADFLAADGAAITAHCPNTGSMAGCLHPGAPALLKVEPPSPTRRTTHTWLAIQGPTCWIGVHTGTPNDLVAALARTGQLPGVPPALEVQREVPHGPHTRFDLKVSTADGPIYIEVKNVSLVLDGVARFPDAQTERGRKHLRQLAAMARQGTRCLMVYVIQREDAQAFGSADHIDPEYGKALRRALKAGVQALALRCRVSPEGLEVLGPVPLVR